MTGPAFAGRYAEAVERLTSALTVERNAATRERSFELGVIVTTQLKEPMQACTHWARHLREFSTGRYGTDIARLRSQLGCDEN